MTDYDKIIDEIEAEDRQRRARAAGLVAPEGGPDRAAAAIKLGETYGVPPGAAIEMLPDLQQRERLDRIERTAGVSAPLAHWLGRPENAALADDDLDVLDKIGRRFNDGLLALHQRAPWVPLTDGAEARQAQVEAARAQGPTMMAAPEPSWFEELVGKFESGWYKGKAGMALLVDPINPVKVTSDSVARGLGYRDAEEYNRRALGRGITDEMRRASAADRESAATAAGFAEIAAADRDGSTMDIVKAAATNPRAVMAVVAESLGTTAPNLALSAAMPASRAMAAITAGTGSFSTEQGMTILDVMGEDGVDTENAEQVIAFLGDRKKMAAAKDRALKRGVAVATFDALTAGLAGRLVSNSRRSIVSVSSRVAGEAGIQAGGGAAGEATAQLASEGRISSRADIVLEAAAEMPTFLAEGRGQIMEARRAGAINEERAAARAERDTLTELVGLAGQSKTRQRAPGRFESLIRDMTEEGTDTVYIPAEAARTLYQSATDDGSDISQLIDPDGLREALVTGGEVAVPLARYVATVTPEQHAAIAEAVRLRPGGLQDMPVVSQEEIQQAIADGLAEAQSNEERDNGAAGRVYDDIYGQLLTRMDEKTARQSASVVQSVYRNLAERVGMDAWALYDQFRVNIVGSKSDTRAKPRGIDIDVDPLLDALRTGKLPTDREIFGDSFVSALHAAGGLRDSGGELANMDAAKARPGLVNNLAGMTLDDAVAWAYQEGFLSEAPTQLRTNEDGTPAEYSDSAPDINTILDMLARDLGGEPVYRANATNVERAKFREDAMALQEELDARGIDLQNMSNAEARRALGYTARELSQSGIEAYTATTPGGTFTLTDAAVAGDIREVLAYDGEDQIGSLLYSNDGTPPTVEVVETHRRRGVATAMLKLAKQQGGVLGEADTGMPDVGTRYRTDDGQAFRAGADESRVVLERATRTLYQSAANEIDLTPGGGAKTAKIGNTTIEYGVSRDGETAEIILVSTPASKRGQGSARAAMQDFLSHTDAAGMTVFLTAEPMGKGGASKTALQKFYKSLGFRINKGKKVDFRSRHAMVRDAQAIEKTETKDQTESKAFKEWAGGAGIVRSEDFWSYEGGPAVFEVFHGTTANFDAFDREKANVESDMGAGFYFTNNAEDVGKNYAGIGPDLENKIQREAERIAGETDRDYDDPDVIEEARARWVQNDGVTLPVYVRAKNPVVIGGPAETKFTYEEVYDEETEEYGDPEGTLIEILDSIREAADNFDEVDADQVVSDVMERASESGGISMSDFVDVVKSSEGAQYATDQNTGDMAVGEFIRQIVENAGYDAIVDYTVDIKFGSQRSVGKKMAGMNDETVHVIAFTPTQIKSSVANRGTFDPGNPSIYAQDGGKNPRGKVTFNDGEDGRRQFDIELLKGMDASTFMHEMGHVYLEVLNDLAARKGAPAQVVADMATLNAWLGREDGAAITTDQHEQFARGFEAYLREGRAPSSALRRAFAAFKVWLTAIYRDVRRLRVDLTDDVRSVMDRIVASDAEIAEARGVMYHEALISDALSVGMTPAQFEAYNAAVSDAQADAEAVVAAETLSALQRETRAWYVQEKRKVREEVTAELRATPVYRAARLLRTGKLPNGELAPDVLRVKLSKDDLLDQFGQSFLRHLVGMYSVEGGVRADEAAALYGFGSGRELVEALVNAPRLADAIGSETDARMANRYPDPMTDGSLPDRAMLAVHRDRQADVMLREIAILERATGRRPTPGGVIKGQAQAIIAGKKLRHLQPATYRAAEVKAGREAFEAAARQDWPAALAARRRQLLNFELFRAAVRARNESVAAARYLSKFGEKKQRARLGKLGGDYLDQVDALLDRFDFRKISDKAADRRASLASWVKAQAERGIDINLPEKLLDEAFRVPYRELTYRELLDVRDAIKSIDHLARLKGKLLLGEEVRDAAEVDAAMAASLRGAHAARPATTGDRLRSEEVRRAFQQGRVLQAAATDLARELDGFADVGAIWTNTVGVIRHAVNNLVTPKLQEAQDALASIYAAHYTKDEIRRFADRAPVPEVNGDLWSKGRILALALNWGNEGNREAILTQASGRLTAQQVGALLGRLDSRDWRFVESVWKLIDSQWPAIAAAQKRRTGLVPDRVQASPFTVQTSDGKTLEIPGGYYPLKYEADSVRTMKEEADEFYNSIRTGRSARAATRNGHTIERVGSGGRTVRLDTGVIQLHLRDVIRDVYLGDAVNYVHNVINGAEFRAAVDETGMQEYRQAMEVWLKDAASGEIGPRVWHERAMRAVRQNFTASVLTWKFVSAALQVSGVVQTGVVVGHANTMGATAQYLRRPVAMTRYVRGASPYMESRMRTHIEAVQMVMDAEAGRFEAGRAAMIRWGYWMIGRVQSIVDTITWMAAESKGMEMFDGDVVRARMYADDVVSRAQGSGEFIDKNPLQRGTLGDNVRQSEWIKATTTLMGYMMAKGNAAYEVTRKTNFKSPRQVLKWMADMAMLFTVEGLIVNAIRGGLPDDDDDDGSRIDDMAEFVLVDTLSTFFGTIPGLSTMVSEFRGYDSGGVLASAWAAYAGLAKQLTPNADGEVEMDKAVVKAAVKTAGVTFGVPSSQANKTIDAIAADADGRDVSPYEYLTGPKKE